MRNTRLLGDLGHAPATSMKTFNEPQLIIDLSVLHYFFLANFTWAQAQVCPGVATPLAMSGLFLEVIQGIHVTTTSMHVNQVEANNISFHILVISCGTMFAIFFPPHVVLRNSNPNTHGNIIS